MIDNSKEYILCAAVKRINPRIPYGGNPYHEGLNDILNIELGYRHHDIFHRYQKELNTSPDSQGFYTSKGRFVNRYEAMKLAIECGQVKPEIGLKSNNYKNKFNITYSDDLSDLNLDLNLNNYKLKYNPLSSEDLY